jgi:selenocysteine-specific elongation factor
VKKVRFFRHPCKSSTKFHISIGHATVIATVTFFGEAIPSIKVDSDKKNDKETETFSNPSLTGAYHRGFPTIQFPWADDFLLQEELQGTNGNLVFGQEPVQWALLQFQQPVFCPMGSLVIGSRLDTDTTNHDGNSHESAAHQCRLAFYGPIKESLSLKGISDSEQLEKLRLYSAKTKECVVYKITDTKKGLCIETIASGLVSEKGSVVPFVGMKVVTSSGGVGTIMSPFGSGGFSDLLFSNYLKLISFLRKVPHSFQNRS